MVKITKDHLDLSNNLLQQLKMPFTGTISLWPSQNPPKNALLCDGNEYEVADYPALASVLGYSDQTKFTVPNFQNRFPLGGNDSGTDISGNIIGGTNKINSINHSHNVTINSMYSSTSGLSSVEIGNGEWNHRFNVGSVDIDFNHNTTDNQIDYLPKYCTVNYIIHT